MFFLHRATTVGRPYTLEYTMRHSPETLRAAIDATSKDWRKCVSPDPLFLPIEIDGEQTLVIGSFAFGAGHLGHTGWQSSEMGIHIHGLHNETEHGNIVWQLARERKHAFVHVCTGIMLVMSFAGHPSWLDRAMREQAIDVQEHEELFFEVELFVHEFEDGPMVRLKFVHV